MVSRKDRRKASEDEMHSFLEVPQRFMKKISKLLAPILSFALPLVAGLWMGHDSIATLLPAAMSAAVAAAFIGSLFGEISLVERFAKLHRGTLTPEIRWYCRWATRYWGVVLILNTILAAWSALGASMEMWLWYNGALSYLIIAGAFGAEYLVRLMYRARLKRQESQMLL